MAQQYRLGGSVGAASAPSGGPGLITDWERCVKTLWVSSRENWAHRLLDRTSSYWQSCGMQGKVPLFFPSSSLVGRD